MNVAISVGALLLAFTTSANVVGACTTPDVSIESFLVHFAENRAFQLDRVAYPLRIKYIPPTSEQSVVEKWPRSKLEKIDWPLFLTLAELKGWGYIQTIRKRSGAQITVRHDSRGDAYVRTFSFHNHNGCWYLESLVDDSL